MKEAVRHRQAKVFSYSDDILINYEEEGHGEVSLVFIHGFAASLSTWHEIRQLFTEDRFRRFYLDLKGFGFSSKPGDGRYGIEDQAEIVIAFIKALQLGNVILVGHSYGGAVALRAAMKSGPDQCAAPIRGLVLLDCAAYPRKPPPLMRLLAWPFPAMALMKIFPVSWIACLTLRRICYDGKKVTPAMVRRYTHSFSRSGMGRVLVDAFRGIMSENTGSGISYKEIPVQTLIIWGNNDRVIPQEQAYRLNGEIGTSRLEIIKECGHIPHEEYPHTILEMITAFINGFISVA